MNADASTLAEPTTHTPARARRSARFDARGCPVSTNSQAAIDHAEEAQWRMHSYYGDAMVPLDAAIAADPHWALPLVMKANLLATMSEFGYAQMAQGVLDAAVALAAGANERERAHMAATQLCLQGQWAPACDAWERLLLDHPQDLAALLPAHVFDFFRGDARNLQRRVARVLPEWSVTAPLYSYVLGMHAFGLEENQHYAQALEAGQAALQLEPRDPWAVHAVTHVHEMRGEHQAGEAWLHSRSADWAPDNAFSYHNWWHLALFKLERLDTAAALEVFDHHVAPGAQFALQRIDVTAMLWRLKLLGVDVGARWNSIADAWPNEAPEAGHYAFNDLHTMLALLGAGRMAEAGQVLEAVRRAAAADHTLGSIAAQVGVPMLQGFMAYGRGQYADAVDTLWAVRDGCHRFGGSHAQRDIVDQTLLDAAVRAGRPRLARHLLNERLPAKAASPLTEHWARRIG
jgi:tetratricopeptide (TPR) repeat protein